MDDLTEAQRRLTDFMSELSEQAWSAGWMRGLEHELWRAVVSGPRLVGRLQVTEEHVAQLRRMSADCNGWIAFDDEREETFVPIERWTANCASQPPGRG